MFKYVKMPMTIMKESSPKKQNNLEQVKPRPQGQFGIHR